MQMIPDYICQLNPLFYFILYSPESQILMPQVELQSLQGKHTP